jgi:Mrp family chromosome partitioning ATPase
VLAAVADGTLLVVSANQTTKRALRRAVELLTQVDAPFLGSVLNNVGPERDYAYGYAAGYYDRRGRSRGKEPAPNGGQRGSRVRANP